MQGLGGSCRSVPPPAVVWRYMVTSIIIIFTNKCKDLRLSIHPFLLAERQKFWVGRSICFKP